jgi:hypothetical protein
LPDNPSDVIDRPPPQGPRLPIALLEWRPIVRNTLRGFAEVRVGRTLIINDCPAHCSHGRKWVALPSKPQLTRERELVRDATGKLAYTPVVEWADRAAANRFSDDTVAVIEAQFPRAFDVEAGS